LADVPWAIGLAYDIQLVERVPMEAHDRPMNMVVTERQVIR
jgi:5-formyltetrahydrofolate cyclo-ligase